MGIGMVLVVPQQQAAPLIEFLAKTGQAAYTIGEVTAGDKQTVLNGGPFHG